MKPQLVPHGGSAEKLGATVTPDGVNFAVYSESASALYVSLYDAITDDFQPFRRYAIDASASEFSDLHPAFLSTLGIEYTDNRDAGRGGLGHFLQRETLPVTGP